MRPPADAVAVDASLAIKWVIKESFAREARALLIVWEQRHLTCLAPFLCLSELNTPLLELRRQGLSAVEGAERAMDDVLTALTLRPDGRRWPGAPCCWATG